MAADDTINLNIRAQTSGGSDVADLKKGVDALAEATNRLDGAYRDANGRLRDARGRFISAGAAAQLAGQQFGQLAAAERQSAQAAEQSGLASRALGQAMQLLEQHARGGFSAFQAGITTLSSGVQIAQQAAQAVQQMVGGMKEWADEANKAATATKVFDLTLSRFAVSTEGANGAAQRLAKEFGLSITDVQDSMTTLIRAGFRDMGQLEQVMRGAAASSIAFGRTAAEGFDRIGDAAVTGLSAALNSIGISENLGPALDKYAKSVNKTADALTDQERAQVLANLVTKATATEVGALSTIQNDYVRAQQQADLATKQLHISMGQLFMPVVAKVSAVTAEATKTVVELVQAFKDGKDPLDTLALKFPALSDPLLRLSEVVDQTKKNFQDAQNAIGPVFERLTPKAQSMAQTVQPALERLGVVFRDLARIAQENFQQRLLPLLETLTPIAMNAVQRLAPVLASVGELFRDVAQLCQSLWDRVLFPTIQKLAPVVQAAVDAAGPILNDLLSAVKNIVKLVTDVINGDWSAAWGHLKGAVGNALLAVNDVIDNLLGKGKLGDKLLNFGTDLAGQFVSGFLKVSAGIENALADAVENAVSRMPAPLQKLLGGAAGWLRKDAANAVDAAGAITDKTNTTPGATLPPARNIPGFTNDKAKSIQAAAAILGVNPNDLAAVISFETAGTFSQSIRNPKSSGTGLIQFMAAEYQGKYGMTRDQFGGLSFEQQMEYVIKYLEQRGVGKNGKNTLADIYQAVAGSGYRRGTQAYELNKVWDSNNDGYISKNEQTLNPRFQAHVRDYFGQPASGTGYSYEAVGRGQFDPKIAIANSVEPGKWTDHFMRTLVEKFKNDPRVDSDCAIIASRVMGELGVKLQGAANDRINAGKLAQQVINSGAQKVDSEAQAKAGDFVHFQGKNYGYGGSGNHVGVVVGTTPDGKAVILQNPGQGNTQILMLDDVLAKNGGKASIYRPKESPYANGKNPAQQPAQATAQAESGVQTTIKALDALDKSFADKKTGLDKYVSTLKHIEESAQKVLKMPTVKGAEREEWQGLLNRVQGSLKTSQAGVQTLVTDEQVRKAIQFKDAVDKATEALKKSPKDPDLFRGLQKAQQDLDKFQKASAGNAEALKLVQGETKKTAGSYIASAAELRKYGGEALQIAKALDSAQKNGTAEQIADAEKRKAAWIGESKMRQSVFDIESRAYGIRKQGEEALTQHQRQQAQQRQSDRVADARRALTLAEQSQADQLAVSGLTESRKAQILEENKPKILAANKALNAAIRNQAGQEANALAEQQKKAGQLSASVIEQTRKDAWARAYKAEREANEDAENGISRTSKQATQSVAEAQRKLRAQMADERRQLSVQEANDELSRIKSLNAAELAAFTGTAQQRKAIVQQQAADEESAALQVARAVKNKAEADLRNNQNLAPDVRQRQQGAIDRAFAQAQTDAARTRAEAEGKAYGEALQETLKSIQSETEGGLLSLYSQAQATHDQTLMTAVYDEWERRRVKAEQDEAEYTKFLESQGISARQTITWEGEDTSPNAPSGAFTADDHLQSQRETAQGLLDTFLALDPAVLHNADTIKIWGDTLKNAAEHEGVTQEQADALAGALDALQQAADLSADDFQTLQGSLRDAMSDGKLTKQEFADLTEQIRLLQDAAKDGVLPKLPEPTSFEEMQRTVAALRESLEADPALISGSTDEIQKQVGVWNEIIDSRVKDHAISVAQGEELKKILGLTVKVGEANREAARAAASDEVAAKPMQDAQDWLSRFAEGKTTTAELRQGLQGVIDDLQVLADTGNESAKQMIEGLKGSIDATKQLDDAVQESKRLQNEQAVESHDFAAQRRFIDEHQQYVVKTAQETFDREKATLLEGTPAYAAAQQRLENARTQAAQEGAKARAQLMLSEIQYYGQLMDMVLGSLGQLTQAMGAAEQQYDAAGKHLSTPWTDLAANIGGAQKAMQTAISMAGDVGKLVASGGADLGAWVSLGTKLVSSIADAIGGFQKAKAEVRKLKEEFASANPLLNAGDYQNAHTRSRGFLADTFGGGPEVVNEIDKIGLKFAQSITKGVEEGITSGIEAALKSGSITDFTKAMNESLGKSIHESMIEAWKNAPAPGDTTTVDPRAAALANNDLASYIRGGAKQQQQTTLQKIWADDIKAYTDALKANDPDKIRAALAKLKEDSALTAQEAEKLRRQMDDLDRELGTGKYSPEAIAQQQRELAQSRLGIEDQTNELLHTQGLRSDREYEAEKLRLSLERIRLEMEAALAAEGLTEEQKDLIRQQFGLQSQQAQAAYDKQLHDAQVAAEKDVQDKLRSVAENNLEIQHAQGILKTGEYESRKLQLALDRLNAEEKAALDNTDLTEGQRLAISQQYASQRDLLSAQATEAERQRQEAALKALSDLQLNNAETALGIEEKVASAAAVTEEQKWQVQQEFARRRLDLTLRRLDAEQQAELTAADLTAEMRAEIDRKYALARQSAQADIDAQELQHQQQIAQSWQQSLTGGITALLEGNSPLKALYDGVRSRIAQAIQDGFIARRLEAKLDPLFAQLDDALNKGLDPNGIIQKIGTALPGLSVEMQTTLGPIFAQLNASIPKLTDAVNGNTAAVKEMQFTQTAVVQSGPSLRLDSPYRAMFARYN